MVRPRRSRRTPPRARTRPAAGRCRRTWCRARRPSPASAWPAPAGGSTAAPASRCRTGAGCRPAPRRCSGCARRQSAGSGGRPPNSGWLIHRSRNAGTPSRSTSAARSSSPSHPAHPFGVVDDARVGADHRQPTHDRRVEQRRLQAQPAAEAVADVRRPAAHPRQHVGRVAQVGAHAARSAVAGEVDDDGLVAPAGDLRGDRLPRRRGLGEPVAEDDALARAERRGRQWSDQPAPVRHHTSQAPSAQASPDDGGCVRRDALGRQAPQDDGERVAVLRAGHRPRPTEDVRRHGGDAQVARLVELVAHLDHTVVAVEEGERRRRGPCPRRRRSRPARRGRRRRARR